MSKERDLMLRAGWMHLVEGQTQEAVARRLGLTRAKVNRLIADCRASGLMRITIDVQARLALQEESALKQRYGLQDAWVVPAAETREAAITGVAAAAGSYVSEHLAPGQVLALGWGRTLSAAITGLQPRKPQGNRVVSLLGSIVHSNSVNSFDIASRFAHALSADCSYLIAPRIAESAETAARLRASPYVAEALDIAAGAALSLIGVDDLSTASTLFATGQMTEDEIAQLVAGDAVCMLQGQVLDREGAVVSHPLAGRAVGLELDRFRAIPRRMVAAAGIRKAPSIHALLSAGHCNILITDERTAEAVLALPAT